MFNTTKLPMDRLLLWVSGWIRIKGEFIDKDTMVKMAKDKTQNEKVRIHAMNHHRSRLTKDGKTEYRTFPHIDVLLSIIDDFEETTSIRSAAKDALLNLFFYRIKQKHTNTGETNIIGPIRHFGDKEGKTYEYVRPHGDGQMRRRFFESQDDENKRFLNNRRRNGDLRRMKIESQREYNKKISGKGKSRRKEASVTHTRNSRSARKQKFVTA